MSSDASPLTDLDAELLGPVGPAAPPIIAWTPRRKFQHRYLLHLSLFVLTLMTTTVVGADHYFGFHAGFQNAGASPAMTLDYFARGLWYSIPLLTFLAAHEFGHYLACRDHDVDATLPFFLPVPFLLTGTMGAVIKIREAFPSKKALFDIGIAGPIAGFIALVPMLFWGVSHSTIVPSPPENSNGLYLGEPLLFKAVAHLFFGTIPAGYEMNLHPMGFAAWFGVRVHYVAVGVGRVVPRGPMHPRHDRRGVAGRAGQRPRQFDVAHRIPERQGDLDAGGAAGAPAALGDVGGAGQVLQRLREQVVAVDAFGQRGLHRVEQRQQLQLQGQGALVGRHQPHPAGFIPRIHVLGDDPHRLGRLVQPQGDDPQGVPGGRQRVAVWPQLVDQVGEADVPLLQRREQPGGGRGIGG